MATATTGEQIAKQLGQDILQGRYAPGQRVGEQAVAEAFALSRGPVRDALRILARQGLVEIRPRRGAFVVELALNDVADIFNVRCALLSLAARYLACNPDKAALARDLRGAHWPDGAALFTPGNAISVSPPISAFTAGAAPL